MSQLSIVLYIIYEYNCKTIFAFFSLPCYCLNVFFWKYIFKNFENRDMHGAFFETFY